MLAREMASIARKIFNSSDNDFYTIFAEINKLNGKWYSVDSFYIPQKIERENAIKEFCIHLQDTLMSISKKMED